VRRLEDTIESLRRDNQELRSNEYVKKLETELQERVKQVENLQDTLKKITKENLELQEKLNTGCCNKRCKKTTRDEDEFYNENFRRMFRDFLDDDMF
jgi:chromosome segregation ATPase